MKDWSARTPAQKQALRAAYKMLAAEFDHFLIVCSMRGDHEALTTDLDVFWKGGWLVANSLTDFAKERIGNQRRNKSEPP